MELISKNIKVLEPMINILDKKNITNCMYYSDINPENECRLYIDTSRLSFVNKTILYTMADVFTDRFSFGDVLFDDKNYYVNYFGKNKKDNFSKHNFVCFNIPNFGPDYNDYTIGFFLEFANGFVQQEPIPEIKDIYTKEEMKRYEEYHKNGLEDQKDIVFLVSLGRDHPLRLDSKALKSTVARFSYGNLVRSHGGKLDVINRSFSLTTDKALNNYSRYKAEKAKEERAKQKAKTTNNG